ncbi:hypothetical protein MVEN_00802500 [Mycena venus]|uniref:Uncharacterized protein n=1 Tax=Mycena venus TaxID=2733690 RepID=A0A8H6YL51_9AGAR|nr:hypothetical protein MVEN_00802500 [Mycena venus]
MISSRLEVFPTEHVFVNSWISPLVQVLCYPFQMTSRTTFAPAVADAILLRTFLIGALACFLCSSVFHSSLCHSHKVAVFMNRIDYFGILALGTVNFFPTFHYAFFCNPKLRNIYIALMTMSGSAGIYMACSPIYATPAYRRARTYTFFACGGAAILPFVHAIWKTGGMCPSVHTYSTLLKSNETSGPKQARPCPSAGSEWKSCSTSEVLCCTLNDSLKVSRQAPSITSFGSSHQIFHICSMFAVLSHWIAIGQGFRYRYGNQGGVCP